MKSTNILSKRNAHVRDANITFYEDTHTYIVKDDNNKYTSVTSWIHEMFHIFDAENIIDKMMNGNNWNANNKYWKMTKQEIIHLWNENGKNARELGTYMHLWIECFLNNSFGGDVISDEYIYNHEYIYNNFIPFRSDELSRKEKDDPTEISYFLKFIKDTPELIPYRTEWVIYDEDVKIAGSVDMVYLNSDGTYSIYDWKRSKKISVDNPFHKFSTSDVISHIPDTNYWHYTLQLNTYKYILEQKYDFIIRDLYLIRLHPDSESYERILLPNISEIISKLFNIKRFK